MTTLHRVEYAHQRKMRERNTGIYRAAHWPIWIFVFFLAPGPLTFDLFAGRGNRWNLLWLVAVLIGTGIAALRGRLRCSRRRSGSLHISQLDLSDIKVRIYGDTAVVTSKADLVGKSGDRDISGRFRYTRVYSNRDGQWRIVSFEASRISGGNEEAKH